MGFYGNLSESRFCSQASNPIKQSFNLHGTMMSTNKSKVPSKMNSDVAVTKVVPQAIQTHWSIAIDKEMYRNCLTIYGLTSS